MIKLGQREVINLLKKYDKPLSVGEIARILNDNQKKISKDINKMIQYKEILFIEIDKQTALEKYNCKHRMRLYFVDGSC